MTMTLRHLDFHWWWSGGEEGKKELLTKGKCNMISKQNNRDRRSRSSIPAHRLFSAINTFNQAGKYATKQTANGTEIDSGPANSVVPGEKVEDGRRDQETADLSTNTLLPLLLHSSF